MIEDIVGNIKQIPRRWEALRLEEPKWVRSDAESLGWEPKVRPESSAEVVYMPPEVFYAKVEDLKASILKGEYDEHLRIKPERLIHEYIMRQIK